MYRFAADYALTRGIIIADTKFEFGIDDAGHLTLIDEALTPDSSRFWPTDTYRPGTSPPSFDKQFVRDYLETLVWDKRPPGPKLPPEVIQKTGEKVRRSTAPPDRVIPRHRMPRTIALIYLAAGILWIFVTDRWVAWLDLDPQTLAARAHQQGLACHSRLRRPAVHPAPAAQAPG